MKKYYVYILTNKSYTLYIGMTSNVIKRIYEHKNKLVKGFTEKYNINKLIYYEELNSPLEAITREKQLKNWSRTKKMRLIKTKNPNFEEIVI